MLKNLILSDCLRYRTTLAYSTSPNNMDVIQTRSQTAQSSLTIYLSPQNIVLLNILRDNFGTQLETDGNEFLYPIQEHRRARQLIGGGSITHALMILIQSHINYHGDTIFSEASDDFRNVNHEEDDWITEAVIARQIIYMFPNTETIEDIINDDSRLSIEIHAAARNYGTLPIPEAPG